MEFRLVKKITFVGKIKDAPDDYEYWKKRPHEERIAAVEFLRKLQYGETTPRLQRVYKIVKRRRG